MHGGDGKSTLASVSKWNSGKVNYCKNVAVECYLLGPVHMIPGQLIAPGRLTGQFCLGTRSDACNCSHEFFFDLGQLREAGYPLYNTG